MQSRVSISRVAQVILGDGNVLLAHPAVLPGGEIHVGQGSVGSVGDEFGRGVTGDGPEHLVLHLLGSTFHPFSRNQSKQKLSSCASLIAYPPPIGNICLS